MGLNNYEIAPIIGKYLQNTISAEEMRALKMWVEEEESHKQFFESLHDTDSINEEIDFLQQLDIETAWQKVKQRKYGKTNLASFKIIMATAATIVLIIGVFIWGKPLTRQIANTLEPTVNEKDVLPGWKRAELILSDGTKVDLARPFNSLKEKDGTEIQDFHGAINYSNRSSGVKKLIYNTLKVPKTGMYQLTLPDGTRAWVNAMSILKFPVQFVGRERRVYLEGEAYFDVAEDYNKPFIVEAAGSQIKVLGTQFNVNAYNAGLTTTLLEGAVTVSKGEQLEVLKPGQEARIIQQKIEVKLANLPKATAWKDGDFYFEKDNVLEVMQQLQRWYDFEIEYQGNIPDKLFSGNISRNSRLSEVLDMLNFLSDGSTVFEWDNHRVRIIFNKQ